MATTPTPIKSSKRRWLLKTLAAATLLTALAFVFIRSARDSRSSPYSVTPADLHQWVLSLETESGPDDPLLVLRPPSSLVAGLFHQIFMRAMESFNAPPDPTVAVILRGEFDRANSGHMTPQALLAAARDAGLDRPDVFKPRCLGYRRSSDARVTQQLYFVLFDSPVFVEFRRQIGDLRTPAAPTAASAFDSAALSPVLFVAAAETTFTGWLPFRATPQTDCVAPIVLSRV